MKFFDLDKYEVGNCYRIDINKKVYVELEIQETDINYYICSDIIFTLPEVMQLAISDGYGDHHYYNFKKDKSFRYKISLYKSCVYKELLNTLVNTFIKYINNSLALNIVGFSTKDNNLILTFMHMLNKGNFLGFEKVIPLDSLNDIEKEIINKYDKYHIMYKINENIRYGYVKEFNTLGGLKIQYIKENK